MVMGDTKINRKLLLKDPWNAREASLNRVFEQDSQFPTYKTLLYIGAKGRGGGRHLKMFEGFDITVLEVWENHIALLQKHFDNVIQADIRDYVDSGDTYDVVMWWHGPEHLPEEELLVVLEKMKKMGKLVILGCPCGESPQGAHLGNPYEVHSSYLQPEFFHALGYNTEALLFEDGRDGRYTNITSWHIGLKKEAPPEYYDKVFTTSKYEKGRQSYYKWAVQVLQDNHQSDFQGLDVGCGPGGFLQEAQKAGLHVDGIDFSSEAVRQAMPRTPNKTMMIPFNDFTGWGDYQYFSILETLEHVEDDIALLQKLPSGSFVVGCVPSFNSPSHLRCFPNGPVDIVNRYKLLFQGIHTEILKNKNLFGFYGYLK